MPSPGDALARVVEQSNFDTGQTDLVLSRTVKPYTRIEHGRLQAVRGYQMSAEARQLIHRLSGSGKKYHPGQGFFIDTHGEKHWGWYGAAGLLIHHTDEKNATRYLLQRRSWGVQHGGTWSTPGGAIDKPGGVLESPAAAAMREGEEEFGKLPKDLTVTGIDSQHFGKPGEIGHWVYHTISVASPSRFTPGEHAKGQAKTVASHGHESGDAKWVTVQEMAKLPLHPGFRPTALKLGMPDVPNPKPVPEWKGNWSSGAWSGKGASLLGTVKAPDDYEKGAAVTWRHAGQTVHGVVQQGVDHKGGLPDAYVVTTRDGNDYKVRWAQLQPAEWSARKPAPVFPGGTSLAQGGSKPSGWSPFKQGDRVLVKGAPSPVGVITSPESATGMHAVRTLGGTTVWRHHSELASEPSSFVPQPAAKASPKQVPVKAKQGKHGKQGKPASQPGYLGKVVAAAEPKDQHPAEDPYFESQRIAAGLPAAGKLPPGPVIPRGLEAKPLRTPWSESHARGETRRAKRGPRGAARLPGRGVFPPSAM